MSKNTLSFATIAEAEKQLLKLNLEKALGKLKNTSQIGRIRREIARMKTPTSKINLKEDETVIK